MTPTVLGVVAYARRSIPHDICAAGAYAVAVPLLVRAASAARVKAAQGPLLRRVMLMYNAVACVFSLACFLAVVDALQRLPVYSEDCNSFTADARVQWVSKAFHWSK